MLFGICVILWHGFGFLVVLTDKSVVWYFCKLLSFELKRLDYFQPVRHHLQRLQYSDSFFLFE